MRARIVVTSVVMSARRRKDEWLSIRSIDDVLVERSELRIFHARASRRGYTARVAGDALPAARQLRVERNSAALLVDAERLHLERLFVYRLVDVKRERAADARNAYEVAAWRAHICEVQFPDIGRGVRRFLRFLLVPAEDELRRSLLDRLAALLVDYLEGGICVESERRDGEFRIRALARASAACELRIWERAEPAADIRELRRVGKIADLVGLD